MTLEDVAAIARVMTLKCAFAGLAAGGAKGGIIVPTGFSPAQREQRLRAFGRAAAALLRSGAWSHGTDMGTTEFDLALVRHAAGLGPDPARSGAAILRSAEAVSSGTAAGWTVAMCAQSALECLGIPVLGARIAIQGLGAVGQAAMASLAAAGARIVAVSTVEGALHDPNGLNAKRLLTLAREEGPACTASGGTPPQALFEAPSDVLLLCAGSEGLDRHSAQALSTRAVVCGANTPFDDEVAQELKGRGILVVPDFVAGCGGVLGSTLHVAAGVAGPDLWRILQRTFLPLVARTITEALANGVEVAQPAQRIAERVAAACERAYGNERPSTLLASRLAPPERPYVRALLAIERRLRQSWRWRALARPLRGLAVAHAEHVLAATLAAGVDPRSGLS